MLWFRRRQAHNSSRAADKLVRTPEHLAIIMDGNGRWAERRHLPRKAGHRAGATNLKRITRASAEAGVSYLTVYAFSTENWKRPQDEINQLMDLFLEFLERYDPELAENNVRLRFIGDRTALSAEVQAAMRAAEARSVERTGMHLILAFNYGGRDEILRSIRKLVESGIPSKDIDEESFRRCLDLPDVPDPDLIVRTSGELRLSNFLLWQAAYSEIYVCDDFWPDFSELSLRRAFEAFGGRKRRFGGIRNE